MTPRTGYEKVNAATESRDSNSLLHFYRDLLRLRKTNDALRIGGFELINPTDPNVLAYLRINKNGKSVIVILNCAPQPRDFSYHSGATTLLSSFAAKDSRFTLDCSACHPTALWSPTRCPTWTMTFDANGPRMRENTKRVANARNQDADIR